MANHARIDPSPVYMPIKLTGAREHSRKHHHRIVAKKTSIAMISAADSAILKRQPLIDGAVSAPPTDESSSRLQSHTMCERITLFLVVATILVSGAVQPASAQSDTGRGTLIVAVPADAQVFVNGRTTSSTGTVRKSYSKGLQTGHRYVYKIRAEATRGERRLVDEKTVTLVAGKTIGVYFELSAPAVALRRLEKTGARATKASVGRSVYPVVALDFCQGDFAPEALELILQFENLRSLRLKNSQITNALLKILCENQLVHTLEQASAGGGYEPPRAADDTKIYRLDLSDTQVTADGLEVLKQLPNLQTLKLDPDQVDKAALKELLASFPTLNLRMNEVTDSVLAALGETRQFHMLCIERIDREPRPADESAVMTLNLYRQPITDAGLEALKGLTNLHTLNLTGTQVTDAGLKHISGLRSLQTLTLYETQVTGAGLKELKGLDNLQKLELGGKQMTDEGLANLRKLGLLHCLSGAGRSNGIRRDSQISFLLLGGGGVTDAGMKELQHLEELKLLFLHKVPVTDKGLRELQPCKQLRAMFLDSDQLKSLKSLKEFKELRVLSLGSTPIAAADLKGLQELPKLRVLALAPEVVTDEVLATLSESNLLEALIVSKDAAGLMLTMAQGFRLLIESDVAVEYWPGLDFLDLSETEVTDAGLKDLSGLKNLRTLYLRRTQMITDGGVRELKAALPKLHIVTRRRE